MNILLGVTGSISCYKTYDLLRLFVKDGHKVKVVTTSGAEKFLKIDLFRYLGASEIYSCIDDFNLKKLDNNKNVTHVELAKWADHFVIAPLSANTLSRLAIGDASDLLCSIFLAFPQDKPISLFPAMNTNMLIHPIVQSNVEVVNKLKNLIVYPTDSGELVCGDEGAGKLLNIEDIFHLVTSTCLKDSRKKTLITTGATIAPLDKVRYLTNPSSGKTGFSLAKAALLKGHEVEVIAGLYSTELLNHLVHHPRFKLTRVGTADHMAGAVHESFHDCDIYISSAAISDIEFKTQNTKIKKSNFTSSLNISKSVDILKSVLDVKRDHQTIVGFAAESELTEEVLSEKIARKPVDILVATKVSSGQVGADETAGFRNDHAEYRIIKGNTIPDIKKLTKNQMAGTLFNDYL